MAPSSPISTLRHPLPWAAAGLILVNDQLLRGAAPGWLTGKLSDVGWLALVPVVAAAALVALGAASRAAQALALAFTAAFYSTLQLWPPLGAWFSAGHVADAGDLLVLPALGLAVAAWRTPAWLVPVPVALAAPTFTAVLLADEWWFPPEQTWPCDDTIVRPTNTPLRVAINVDPDLLTGDRFRRGIHLVDEAGTELDVVVDAEASPVAICARDGLRPETTYTFRVGPWDEGSGNDANMDHDALDPVTFTTDDSEGEPVADPAACAALELAHPITDELIDDCEDSGGDHAWP